MTIEDTVRDRVIRIRKDGSAATVVWNPWIETICVETCNAGSTEVLLEPGEQHRMTTTIDLLPLVTR